MKPYLKYALITCIIVIAWTFVQFYTGIDRSPAGSYLSWLSYIPMIVLMVFALKEQKQLNGGYLTFGQGFKTGFMMMLVVAVVMSVFTYFTFINSELLAHVLKPRVREWKTREWMRMRLTRR